MSNLPKNDRRPFPPPQQKGSCTLHHHAVICSSATNTANQRSSLLIFLKLEELTLNLSLGQNIKKVLNLLH